LSLSIGPLIFLPKCVFFPILKSLECQYLLFLKQIGELNYRSWRFLLNVKDREKVQSIPNLDLLRVLKKSNLSIESIKSRGEISKQRNSKVGFCLSAYDHRFWVYNWVRDDTWVGTQVLSQEQALNFHDHFLIKMNRCCLSVMQNGFFLSNPTT